MALSGWLFYNRHLEVSLVASQEAPSLLCAAKVYVLLSQNCAQQAETYEPLTLVAYVPIPFGAVLEHQENEPQEKNFNKKILLERVPSSLPHNAQRGMHEDVTMWTSYLEITLVRLQLRPIFI